MYDRSSILRCSSCKVPGKLNNENQLICELCGKWLHINAKLKLYDSETTYRMDRLKKDLMYIAKRHVNKRVGELRNILISDPSEQFILKNNGT